MLGLELELVSSWNPGNIPSYEIKSLLKNDQQDCMENKDSANMYVNGNISEKQDIVFENYEKKLGGFVMIQMSKYRISHGKVNKEIWLC